MTIRSVFVGKQGVRSGWRLLAWLLAAGVLESGVVLVIGLVAGVHPPVSNLSLAMKLTLSAVGLAPALAVSFAFTRLFDGETLVDLGLTHAPRDVARELALGMATGAILIGMAMAMFTIGGTASMSRGDAGARELVVGAIGLFASAFKEELWFRGFPFQSLVRGIGPVGATVLFGLLFGSAHLFNEHIDWIGFANDAAAGMLLSLALFARRNLWFPIGLHFAWNFVQGMVLGIPVSGNAGFPSLVATTLKGAPWWTGGDFGLEGSVCGVTAVIVGSALLYAGARRAAPFPGPRRRGSAAVPLAPGAS